MEEMVECMEEVVAVEMIEMEGVAVNMVAMVVQIQLKQKTE